MVAAGQRPGGRDWGSFTSVQNSPQPSPAQAQRSPGPVQAQTRPSPAHLFHKAVASFGIEAADGRQQGARIGQPLGLRRGGCLLRFAQAARVEERQPGGNAWRGNRCCGGICCRHGAGLRRSCGCCGRVKAEACRQPLPLDGALPCGLLRGLGSRCCSWRRRRGSRAGRRWQHGPWAAILGSRWGGLAPCLLLQRLLTGLLLPLLLLLLLLLAAGCLASLLLLLRVEQRRGVLLLNAGGVLRSKDGGSSLLARPLVLLVLPSAARVIPRVCLAGVVAAAPVAAAGGAHRRTAAGAAQLLLARGGGHDAAQGRRRQLLQVGALPAAASVAPVAAAFAAAVLLLAAQLLLPLLCAWGGRGRLSSGSGGER